MSENILIKLNSINLSIFGAFIGALINLPLMFYCSYRKPGTVLLTLSIYSSFFAVGMFIFDAPSIYRAFQHIHLFQNSGALASEWAASVLIYALFVRFLTLGIVILWAIYCRKLKHFNLQERVNRIMSNETYRKLFVELESISHPNQLEECYSHSVREHPSIEKFLTQKYKKRKRELTCSQSEPLV